MSRRGPVSRRYRSQNITSSEAARRFVQSQQAKGLPVSAEHLTDRGVLVVTDHTGNRIELGVAWCPGWLGRHKRPVGNKITLTDSAGRSFVIRLDGPPTIILGANPNSVEFDSSVLGGVG